MTNVNSKWTFADYRGALFTRLFNFFRNDYKVAPGLYSLNDPTADSPVIVTANYTLTFNHVRRALKDRAVWILVLDTKGINVWCAAGKGTFGTNELLKQILMTNLHEVVSHRDLILPQLGASNMKAHEVQKKGGFRVHYGPVSAYDIPAYLDAGMKADKRMRRIEFTFFDRLILTPMELTLTVKKVSLFAAIVFLLSAVSSSGIDFHRAIIVSAPFLVAALTGWLTGAILTPILLPILPFRSFALKGALTGILTASIPLSLCCCGHRTLFELMFIVLSVPAFSSWLFLNFTGTTTFTNPSGVRKEMKASIPVYLASAVILALLIIVTLIKKWCA